MKGNKHTDTSEHFYKTFYQLTKTQKYLSIKPKYQNHKYLINMLQLMT